MSLTYEQIFLTSWDEVAPFFTSSRAFPWVKPVGVLVGELRSRGYDRLFRAGTATWFFVMSRSKVHGLRPGQHSLSIRSMPHHQKVWFVYEDSGTLDESVELDRPEMTPDVERLLARLASQPID